MSPKEIRARLAEIAVLLRVHATEGSADALMVERLTEEADMLRDRLRDLQLKGPDLRDLRCSES